MFSTIVENAKSIGIVLGRCTGIGTGYVALDMPVPASKSWVIAENSAMKARIIDSQIQTNSVQRQLLRKEKFDREIDVQKTADPQFRGILQNRLYQIDDELRSVEQEHDKLRSEKGRP